MTLRVLLIVAILATGMLPGQVSAVPFNWIEFDDVRLCPAGLDETIPPDFDGPTCSSVSIWNVDPQQNFIWIRANLPVSETLINAAEPLGIHIWGKASSDIYLNGIYIGSNGTPGATRVTEMPGRMDAVIYAPKEVILPGQNELVIRMSGQHGFLRLAHPLHVLGIDTYEAPADFILRAYWPAFFTFGVFVLGMLYFGVRIVGHGDRSGAVVLFLISVFAAGQLTAEILRGLVAYPYPFHDVRLILIVVFSLGIGLCLAAHIIGKFMTRLFWPVMAGVTLLTTIGIFLIDGFDGKAATAIFIPASVCCVGTIIWLYQKRPQSGWYLLALAGFIGLFVWEPGRFLDVLFFYAVATLLLFFFFQQALSFSREERLRQAEIEKSRRLEFALTQAQESEGPSRITIKSAGKMNMVTADGITHCKGAGDYVELALSDGGQVLHSGSLTDLEKTLPSTFLRVHRSHIVNTAFVKTLNREPSGNGKLILSTGIEVPVSRRIMPTVRNTLTSDAYSNL